MTGSGAGHVAADPVGRSTRQRPGLAVSLLTAWLVVLFTLPARLELEGFGPPSVLVGLGLGALWAAGALTAESLPGGRQPMRTALLVLAVMLVVGYIVAARRVLSPAEAVAANRTLVHYGAALGVALLATDALVCHRDLTTVVRRVVWAGVFLGGLGTLHGLVGIELASQIELPPLTWSRELAVGIERVRLDRVLGTATHPIEYGVVLAMILPFAIHLAVTRHQGHVTRWWVASSVIGSAALYSLSRSAAIGLGITIVATVLSLPSARLRQRFVLALVVGVLAVQAVAPGVLGTIRGLFVSLTQDGSYQSRVIDYGVVDAYIQDDLWIGRGLGTFLPDEYALLDNQMLKLVLEVGVLGVAVFIGTVMVGIFVGRTVRRRHPDPVVEDLARTIQVSLLVGLVTCFTFDFLGFTIARSMLFLVLGLAGALWRTSGVDVAPSPVSRGLGLEPPAGPPLAPHEAVR